MDINHAIRYLISMLLRGRPSLPPGIQIGKNVFIDNTALLDWRFGKHITLCDGAVIGHKALLLCHDRSSLSRISAMWIAPIYVGERAFIGADSVLLPGVRIGKDALVAAGAVVTKDVEPGVIVAGVPARPIGRIENLDRRRLEELKKRRSFDARIVFSNSARVRDSIHKEQMEAAEKDGGYYIVFTNENTHSEE